MIRLHGLDLGLIGRASKAGEDLSFPNVFCILHGGEEDLEEVLSEVSKEVKENIDNAADAIAGAMYVLPISFVGAREHKKIPALIEALTAIESRLRMLAKLASEQTLKTGLTESGVKLTSIKALTRAFDKIIEELKAM